MRIRTIALSILLAFAFAACGGSDDISTDQSSPDATEEETSPTTAPASEETPTTVAGPASDVPMDDCAQDPDPSSIESLYGLPPGSLMLNGNASQSTSSIELFVCSYVNVDYDEVGKVTEIAYMAQVAPDPQPWDVVIDNHNATVPEAERMNPDDNPTSSPLTERGNDLVSTSYAHNGSVICTASYMGQNREGLSPDIISDATSVVAADACGV